MHDGAFHLFGGLGVLRGTGAVDDVGGDFWRFDEGHGWTRLADGPPAARYPSLASLGGAVYLFGGCGADATGAKAFYDHLWTFDGRAWTEVAVTGPKPHPRYAAAMVAWRGRLVMLGGAHQTPAPERHNTYFDDVWLFDPVTRTWERATSTGPGPGRRYAFASAIEGDRLYIYGGHDGDRNHGDFLMLDLTTMTWSRLDESGPGDSYCGALAVIDDAPVLAGGRGLFTEHWLRGTWRRDPTRGAWDDWVGDGPGARAKAGVATAEGVLYVCCGETPAALVDDLWRLDRDGWRQLDAGAST